MVKEHTTQPTPHERPTEQVAFDLAETTSGAMRETLHIKAELMQLADLIETPKRLQNLCDGLFALLSNILDEIEAFSGSERNRIRLLLDEVHEEIPQNNIQETLVVLSSIFNHLTNIASIFRMLRDDLYPKGEEGRIKQYSEFSEHFDILVDTAKDAIRTIFSEFSDFRKLHDPHYAERLQQARER